jgi:hypothetical protein
MNRAATTHHDSVSKQSDTLQQSPGKKDGIPGLHDNVQSEKPHKTSKTLPMIKGNYTNIGGINSGSISHSTAPSNTFSLQGKASAVQRHPQC